MLLEREKYGTLYFFTGLSGCGPRVCSDIRHIRNSFCPDSGHNKGIDLLQDFFQGRLLLGARAVNARANSEYNHALCIGLRRLADSKETALTQTAAGKARGVSQDSSIKSRTTSHEIRGNVCKLEPFNGLFILQGLSYNTGNTPPKLCCYGVMQN